MDSFEELINKQKITEIKFMKLSEAGNDYISISLIFDNGKEVELSAVNNFVENSYIIAEIKNENIKVTTDLTETELFELAINTPIEHSKIFK